MPRVYDPPWADPRPTNSKDGTVNESRFTDPTGVEHAPGMAHADGFNPPRGLRQSPETVTADPIDGIKRATPNGRPTRWSTVAPDLFGRTSTESRVTRNKRRTSYVAGSAIPWNRTTGDDGMVDPATDAVLRVRTGSDDETAYGMTNERDLVRAADAILAGSAGLDVESPQGNVTRWDDEHALGGLRLTDRPYERSASRRAMLPTFVGPYRGDRSMIGATSFGGDDWCHDHETAVDACGCVKPRSVTLGACTRHVYELAGLADSFGHSAEHDGSTSVSDANRVRASVRAPGRSRAYDVVDVLAVTATGRKIRGTTSSAVTVIYDRTDNTATVHDDGAVTSLLSFVEHVENTADGVKVTRVPWLGHAPLDVEPRRDRNAGKSTRSARDAARSAARSIADRRHALAVELAAVFGAMAVGAVVDVESVGALSRTRSDRYAARWHDAEGKRVERSAATGNALAVKLARELATS